MRRPEPTRIRVERVDGRTRITDLTASRFLRPRLLGGDPERPRVALVANCASLLAGDDLRLDVHVGAGAHLELVEPSGTVVYNSDGELARWSAQVRVEEAGRLVWGAAPFVVSGGARVQRHTGIDLAPEAVVLLRETLVLGRSGESGGRLRSVLRADLERRPLFVEELALDDERLRDSPAVLGGARVLGTVALLGTRPEELVHPHESVLHGPGAIRRELHAEAHLDEAALAPTWDRWRETLTAADPSRFALMT
ncbi:urease accessory protein UreD [Janibacter alittae]|uniref:Urease accessory protein UreD n=1 Tax=Janibacter alittae TaxID=3115209 RepID=A0ABZ2MHX0_9MICO